MTSGETASFERHDFRKPSQLDGNIHRRLEVWHAELRTLALEKWSSFLAFEVQWQIGALRTVRPSEALDQLSESSLAYRFRVNSEPIESILAVTQPLALGIVSGMLGESEVDEEAVNRDLTMVENSLAELWIQETLSAMAAAWPESEPISCEFTEVEVKPKRSRYHADDEVLAHMPFTISGPFGSEECCWLMPLEMLERLLNAGQSSRQSAEQKANVEVKVKEIPICIVAGLGQATIPVSQLANLQVGDVVLLEQRISDPVPVRVEDTDKFLGWPGRIGTRQAVWIESPDQDSDSG